MSKEHRQQSFPLRRNEALGLLPNSETIYGYMRVRPGRYSKCSLSLHAVVDSFPEIGAFTLRKLGRVWVISLVYVRKGRTMNAYLKPDGGKRRRFMRLAATAAA